MREGGRTGGTLGMGAECVKTRGGAAKSPEGGDGVLPSGSACCGDAAGDQPMFVVSVRVAAGAVAEQAGRKSGHRSHPRRRSMPSCDPPFPSRWIYPDETRNIAASQLSPRPQSPKSRESPPESPLGSNTRITPQFCGWSWTLPLSRKVPQNEFGSCGKVRGDMQIHAERG